MEARERWCAWCGSRGGGTGGREREPGPGGGAGFIGGGPAGSRCRADAEPRGWPGAGSGSVLSAVEAAVVTGSGLCASASAGSRSIWWLAWVTARGAGPTDGMELSVELGVQGVFRVWAVVAVVAVAARLWKEWSDGEMCGWTCASRADGCNRGEGVLAVVAREGWKRRRNEDGKGKKERRQREKEKTRKKKKEKKGKRKRERNENRDEMNSPDTCWE